MDWKITQDEAIATSEFHDDGSPFLYYFTRGTNGWDNETDAEIVSTPTLPSFTTLEAAKGWAERNEAAMNAIHAKRQAAEARPTPAAKERTDV